MSTPDFPINQKNISPHITGKLYIREKTLIFPFHKYYPIYLAFESIWTKTIIKSLHILRFWPNVQILIDV